MIAPNSQTWYSVHVPAGLPDAILRAANERQISPGEFLELAVQTTLARDATRPFTISSLPSAAGPRRKPDEFVLAFG